MKIYKNLLALILGLLFSILFLFALEFIASLSIVQNYFNQIPRLTSQEQNGPFQKSITSYLKSEAHILYSDEILRIASEEGIERDFGAEGTLKLRPNSHFHQKLISKKSKTLIVESDTTYDEYYRRKTEVNPKAKFNLFLLGGSFTLGHFVGDQENFPYLLSTKLKEFQVYNMGIGGGAPNLMLYDLEEKINPQRWQNIPSRDSIAVYTFIDDHINRVICRVECYGSRWMLELPYYQEQDSSFAENGMNQDHLSQLDLMMLKLFSQSSLLKLFKINYPLQLKESDYVRFASLVAEVKKRIEAKNSLKDFYVLLYPGMSSHYGRQIIPFLEKHKIKIIDLSNTQFDNQIKKQLAIPGDGHPSPFMHKLMAEIISEQLSIN